MTAPLVSVIIPNYNYARYLPGAIESVLRQTHEALEVLVVDDGSTDDSRQVATAFGDRIRLLTQSNQGVAVARNRGAQHAAGEWVAFLDADDEWTPTKIERQLAAAASSGSDMTFTGVEVVDEAGRHVHFEIPNRDGRLLRDIALLRMAVPFPASTILVRRSLFEAVGGFDPRLSTSADWDLIRRLSARSSIAAVREPLARYRLHSRAMHLNVDVMERDMLLAFEKMFSDPAALEVRPLRRQCYGRLYLILSGSFAHSRKWRRAVSSGLKSLLYSPSNLIRIAGAPLRIAYRAAKP